MSGCGRLTTGTIVGVALLVSGLTGCGDDRATGAAPHRARATPEAPRREPTDISRDLPPRPVTLLPAGSPDSLFRRANLTRITDEMIERFGGREDLIAFALYPSEADFVVVEDGLAQVVRAPADGAFDVGDRTGFEGTRTAVTLQQIRPESLARTLDVIRTRGHVRLADLDRVVLDLTSFGNLAGYRVEPKHGLTTYKALLTGGRVDVVGPGGTDQLR
ncbi:MAG: hypothetical protein QOI80_1766 [Solirubrobacteraceae bacterium]|jgi:hypothetical protein|nr:hypothetical protein [Solirubrobacteraceae bacterium]